MPEYTIRQIAEELDLSPRALRFYEEKGLINPARKGVSRLYSEQDRQRVADIMRLRKFGFTLREIRNGSLPRKKYMLQLEIAKQQRADLDEVIAQLELVLAA